MKPGIIWLVTMLLTSIIIADTSPQIDEIAWKRVQKLRSNCTNVYRNQSSKSLEDGNDCCKQIFLSECFERQCGFLLECSKWITPVSGMECNSHLEDPRKMCNITITYVRYSCFCFLNLFIFQRLWKENNFVQFGPYPCYFDFRRPILAIDHHQPTEC